MRGDNKAADELVRRYYRWLLFIVRRKFPNQNFHLDVVQEAFTKTLKALHDGAMRNPDAVLAFLRSTAINIGSEHLRDNRKHESAIDPDCISDTIEAIQRENPDLLHWEQMIQRLKKCIEKLTVTRDRNLLRRMLIQHEDKATICDALNLSPEHFDRVLYRVKQRIRKCLDDHDDPSDPDDPPDNGNGSGYGPAA